MRPSDPGSAAGPKATHAPPRPNRLPRHVALQVLLPAGAHGYLSMPIILPSPPQGRNASGESAGFNSAGVAVSATESIYNSPAALAADPYVPSGVSEDAIPSLALPLARSARHGARILGRLVEHLGASEGFGVLLADGSEAWYLETASGHHWLAQRVPHGSIFVAGNQARLAAWLPSALEWALQAPPPPPPPRPCSMPSRHRSPQHPPTHPTCRAASKAPTCRTPPALFPLLG